MKSILRRMAIGWGVLLVAFVLNFFHAQAVLVYALLFGLLCILALCIGALVEIVQEDLELRLP